MTRSSTDTPAQSAAQAAIAAPSQGAAEALQRIARCATEQLERGRDLPLALLMDCEQLLGLPIGLRPTWREQERQPHYERWLDNVVAEMRRWWSGNDARLTLDAVAALIPPRDATPPADHGRLAELRKVAAGATESVLQSWRGPRRRAD
jgi:hypothetical protein